MTEQQPLVGETKAPPSYDSSPPPSGPPQYAEGYPPQPTTTTVVTQPVITQQVLFLGEHPVQVTCPTGGHVVTTNVTYKNGTLTYLMVGVLCFLVGPCCALIPFCIDSLKDVEHTCPIDGTVIGVYKKA